MSTVNSKVPVFSERQLEGWYVNFQQKGKDGLKCGLITFFKLGQIMSFLCFCLATCLSSSTLG